MSGILQGVLASINAERVVAPQYIVTISNGGTLAFTYNVTTNTLTNVSSTYVPAGNPASAGGLEGVATNGNGTKVISTGWFDPLRCATFDLASTPWVMTSQGSLPIGSSGNRLGGCPSVNSRGTYVMVSSAAAGGVYYSTATGNSWTSMSVAAGAYARTGAGHNRFYIANGNTDFRCYDGTGVPTYISSINCGSSDRMSVSERTYNPNSYTNPPTNEIIVVSGVTSAIILYTASTNTYSVLRQGSVSDGLPQTYGAGVTRDGTRAVFASGSRAYIYNINPNAGTASLLTDFPIAYGVGYAGGVDIFPSGNMIAVMDSSTMGIYDLNGTLKTTIAAGTYGLTCVYNGVNAV
jgi:hypothetical protein